MPDSPSPNPPVPWDDVTRFVRQLSHDLRNHLNAAELQSVFLNELTADPEMQDEIKRLRQMLSESSSALQSISASIAAPRLHPISYKASDLAADIRQKLENTHPDRKDAITWKIEPGDETFDVDPQILEIAISELFENAFRNRVQNSTLTFTAGKKGNDYAFTLSEPKAADFAADTKKWGRSPFQTTGQGRYGLGLNRVRTIVEAHGGRYEAKYDATAKELVSTIILPLSTGKN
jgi:K+-sensing histidine kinase KdpD